MKSQDRKTVTYSFIREARTDYIGLRQVLGELAGGYGLSERAYDKDEVLELLEYWIEHELFTPLQGRTDTDELFEWEGTTKNHLDRLYELYQEDFGFYSNRWGIWFELTERGRNIADPSDLP